MSRRTAQYYDWTRFNKKHFSDWHRWMAQIVKKNLPHVPVHAKIMVFYSLDRDKLSYGVDPGGVLRLIGLRRLRRLCPAGRGLQVLRLVRPRILVRLTEQFPQPAGIQ